MDNRELMIHLHTLKGVGWKAINKLMIGLDSLDSIFSFTPIELSMKTGIEFSLAETIINKLDDNSIKNFYHQYQEWLNKKIRIITLLDAEYPIQLKEIFQPPWVIYTIGNLDLLHQSSIAMVGTRNPTPYGKYVTNFLSKELVEYGLVIISGMARGIDRHSHQGALDNDGNTVAVLGSGIDVVYPKENIKLYERISEKGLIISEYHPGIVPHPGHFPQRNRIISGISLGTVVIEASLKSGSLITAQFALEQSRDVYAVPGPITSEQSMGTNALIQQGAKLIQNGKDILDEYSYLSLKKKNAEDSSILLNEKEQSIYDVIGFKPIHMDELLQNISLDLSNLYECLLTLQLKNKINQLPGGVYVRKQ